MKRTEADWSPAARCDGLWRLLSRCVQQGKPRQLCRLDYAALEPGATSQPVVLNAWRSSVVVLAICTHDLGRWLWLQVGYKVCAPLFDQPMLVVVPPREPVCVNRWRPSDFVDELEPGAVDLYGWEWSDGD